MPVFNVAKAFNKKSSGQDYSYLIDQLQIKENQLGVDGVLSSGDYDELMDNTYQMLSNPGLTSAQRGDLTVKISSYKKSKSVAAINKDSDIGTINREYKDNMTTSVNIDGNDPNSFLQDKAFFLKNKINQLNSAIDQTSVAEGDISKYTGEIREATLEWQNVYESLAVIENHVPGDSPKSGTVAYVETNDKGQIIDVDYTRVGSKSGYLETNAVMGGFQVHGKLNRKEGDDNVFLLGGDRYKAADVMLPDPITGGMKASTLVYDDPTQTGMKISSGGYHEVGIADEDGTPLLSTQGIIGTDGWGKGPTGNLYNRMMDGSNVKYTGEAAIKKMQELESSNTRILNLNRVNEGTVNQFSTETVSTITPTIPQDNMGGASMIGPQIPTQQQAPAAQASPDPVATGGSGPIAPTTSSPQSSQGVAAKTQQAATGFFGKIGNLFR